MNKVIFANIALLNVGDKAIYDAMEKALREEGLISEVLAVEDINPPVSRKVYPNLPIEHFPFVDDKSKGKVARKFSLLRSLIALAFIYIGLKPVGEALAEPLTRKAIARIKQSDVVISTGGTYLIEHYGYWRRMMGFLLAIAYKKPVILFTQSLGPFTSPLGKRLVRFTFSRVSLILLREEKSLSHVAQLGISTKHCRIARDVVFCMADLKLWKTRKYPKKPKNIAISVRDCAAFHANGKAGQKVFEQNLAHLVTHLVEEYSAHVTFISTCQGVDEYHYNDSVTAAAVCKLLPQAILKSVTQTNHFMQPLEFQKEMEAFDLLIATRMHAAIQGLNAGTPVMPIAYEFKTNELWAGFNLSDYLIDFNEPDPDMWTEKVDMVINTYADYTSKLEQCMIITRAEAMKAAKYVREVLSKKR